MAGICLPNPTLSFRRVNGIRCCLGAPGTELYSRNLKLLVPFFESPSIGLENMEKGVNTESNFLLATWKLRTYLKFPWRPFISIDGSTIYELNDKFKVVRHAESWNVSALEAIGQIFTPSFWRADILKFVHLIACTKAAVRKLMLDRCKKKLQD
ncbi:hypothetical protein RCOM_1428170 [Ricinus communis]|uniref:Uncharacterized protein n=1 Tax=Ricinus communis TaxID=3988 RepID=B9RES3_RICCO|nr:hypothetical protein RCOM_1428170 [Ricinus communis]